MSDFVVLLQKAARGPAEAGAAASLAAAVQQADVLYEQSKVLHKAGFCPNGVAVLVLARPHADRVLAQRCVWASDHSHVLWQAGSY